MEKLHTYKHIIGKPKLNLLGVQTLSRETSSSSSTKTCKVLLINTLEIREIYKGVK
jgi:hypothetical protein